MDKYILDENLFEYWEDNGYKQHVWIIFSEDEHDKIDSFKQEFGEPDGEGDYADGYVLDYYFNTYEDAKQFTDKLPNDINWSAEETDED